jgi:hypothetical protein
MAVIMVMIGLRWFKPCPPSAAVFHNRISRFQFSEPNESEAATANSAAFAAVPTFAMAGAAGASADIYRLAQQQAQQQVAARRERARRSHEWN